MEPRRDIRIQLLRNSVSGWKKPPTDWSHTSVRVRVLVSEAHQSSTRRWSQARLRSAHARGDGPHGENAVWQTRRNPRPRRKSAQA
jgi:hypothetical protein